MLPGNIFGPLLLSMVNCDFDTMRRCKLWQCSDGQWYVTRDRWVNEKDVVGFIPYVIASCTTEKAARAAFALLRNGPEAYLETTCA